MEKIIRRYLLPNASIRLVKVSDNHFQVVVYKESNLLKTSTFKTEEEGRRSFDLLTSKMTEEVHKVIDRLIE